MILSSKENFIHSIFSSAEDTQLRLIEPNIEKNTSTIPSPFYDLDYLTGGLRRKELLVVRGISGAGKTTFALNLAVQTAQKNLTVGFFSQEVNQSMLKERILSICSGVETHRIRTEMLGDLDLARLSEAAQQPVWRNLLINDLPNISLTNLLSTAWQINQNSGLDLLIIDRLEWVKLPKGYQNQAVTRYLRRAAQLLDTSVIGVSTQTPILNPNKLDRYYKDADQVVYLDREELRKPDTERRGLIDLYLCKNRSGQTGKFFLLYLEKTGQITDLKAITDSEGLGEPDEGILYTPSL